MNTMNRIKMMLVGLLLVIFGTACEKELDVAPVLSYDGEANMTIAELCELHAVGSQDSYSEIPDGTVITGIVTSSDKSGNCYKYLTIQDETGAIMIKIDDSSLDPKYRIGQRVYVECGDMVIGDYRKNKQLGFWIDGSMAGISSSQEDLYIFRDGVCGAEPEAVTITSKYDIDESMYNKLVKLENCHFDDGGSEIYCEPNASTSRNIVMADNSIIVLRTSNYANFASEILPEGNGDIYGILTIYNTTPQLVIRSIEDVHIGNGGGGNVNGTVTVFQPDLTNDPIANQGWSVQGDAGWFYYAAGEAFAIQNPNSTTIDSWLVSPAITGLEDYEDVYVEIDDNANPTPGSGLFEMYYTTDFNGSFTPAVWTRFNKNEILPDYVVANQNFRIAFRYKDANGANWRINDIKVKGTSIR